MNNYDTSIQNLNTSSAMESNIRGKGYILTSIT